jgi:hypothetical protein
MLNFLTIKKDNRFEYRLYKEDSENVEGTIIYKGHKLGVKESVLSTILEYKLEKRSNRIYMFDYDSCDKWFVGSTNDYINVINQSYDSLQTRAEKELGKFRKIIITRL